MRESNRWLCGLIFAFCALGLTSCDRQTPLASKIVTLRFWNGFTGPDGRTMLAMIRRFNEENPDVHVIMQRMEWGTYYNKLFVAAIGGRSPEVFVIHADSMARFQRAGLLRQVDDLFGGNGLDLADFDQNVSDAVVFGAHRFGVPLDIHMLGMYYNRTLFREAGIVDASGQARPPTNREEFLDAAKRITKRNGNASTWGFVFTWLRTNCFTIMRQFDGTFFNESADRTTIASQPNRDGLQFCVDLIRALKVSPAPQDFDAFIGFRQGKVGMVFEGIYMLPELQRQTDLDWAAAPVPTLGPKQAAWCNSHTLCLRPDLKDDELAAAKKFVRFLSDNSLDWAEGGQIPVRKSLRESKRFQSMTAQREFAKQIPHAAYMPRVLFVNEYLEEFERAIDKALRGSATPEQALATAQSRIEAVIERYRSWSVHDSVGSAAH